MMTSRLFSRLVLGFFLAVAGGVMPAQQILDPVPVQSEAFDPAAAIEKVFDFPIDVEGDRVFLKDMSPTPPSLPDCKFHSQLSGGAIEFDIPIDRFVGDVDGDNRLLHAGEMDAQGLLDANATLLISAYDVDNPEFNFEDTDADPEPIVDTIGEERDIVSVNGFTGVQGSEWLLEGKHDQFSLNVFEVPIQELKFPEKGQAGSPPQPVMNRVKIVVDELWGGIDCWCVGIQWAALVIRTVSPILLIHGNDSEPEFFNRQGFSSFLRDKYWPHDGCAMTEPAADGCDNPIFLPAGAVESFETEDGVPVKGNDEVLAELIPPIVNSFGVDSIHLVVHSKGGLDSRAYLVNHQPSLNDQFKILSYTSLSTPHHGSVGADLEIAYRDALMNAGASVEFKNLPELTETLAELLPPNEGTPYLTSGFVAQFNITNRPELPRSIEYQTVAADADSDGNFVINDVAEYDGFREESLALWAASSVVPNYTTIRINALYQIMRFTSVVSLTETTLKFGGFEPDVVSYVIEGHPVDDPEGNPNDLMVTLPSGHGLGAVQRTTIDGENEGRDHANVADRGVAELVDDWILFVEKFHEFGDLDDLKK